MKHNIIRHQHLNITTDSVYIHYIVSKHYILESDSSILVKRQQNVIEFNSSFTLSVTWEYKYFEKTSTYEMLVSS